jgi:hypothetical protein
MRPESHERHILLYGANPKCAICDIILDDNEKIVARKTLILAIL